MKENRIPKAMELTARLESSLALIIIAPASAIVGIEDSKITIMLSGLNSILRNFKIPINKKGATSVLHKMTIVADL